ncbi:MAG TPA: MAPEG family protein [Alphaproteobacteria bacterium]
MTAFPLQATAIYAGILLLIGLVLGALTTRARVKNSVLIGDGGKEPVIKAIRAHANFAEYVPLAVIGIGLAEMAGGPAWLVHGMGVVLVLARLAHAQGMYQTTALSPGRLAGATLTWIVYLVAGLASLYYGFGLQG